MAFGSKPFALKSGISPPFFLYLRILRVVLAFWHRHIRDVGNKKHPFAPKRRWPFSILPLWPKVFSFEVLHLGNHLLPFFRILNLGDIVAGAFCLALISSTSFRIFKRKSSASNSSPRQNLYASSSAASLTNSAFSLINLISNISQ